MIRVFIFSNDLRLRGLGSSYIAQRVQHEPLDQTDMKNGTDAILGGGGGTFWKLETRGHHGILTGTGGSLLGFASVESLLESSRTFPRRFRRGIISFYSELQI
jgi:hypothetical protein